MNNLIKGLLTLLLVAIVCYPIYETGASPRILEELNYLGTWGTILVVLVFFGAIALYCRALQRLLEQVPANCRTRSPKSVWWMYLIPVNFIEDFFIMIDLSNTLKQTAEQQPALKKYGDFGLTLGLGWSIAQLLSLIPNMAGLVAGLIGLLLWVGHWYLVHQMTITLKTAK